VLVRTYAWLILLTDNGPVNGALIKLGLIDSPLSLLFNETGAVIGMVHIMLPFFVLPVFGVIRAFDWGLLQAAASLGAPPVSRFLRIFLPLSLPGVLAGAVFVFVQCLGFYVTPAVLGGGKVTMVSMKIASNIQQYFDWGAASALGIVLLVCALSILYFANRLLDLDRILGTR
jgi:putative spermidine/putrescine transport system permease protein/spermidine/putrescine transport system permease protein